MLPLPVRVLVTGGCGFIGNHLVRRLLAEGHEVVVLDDLSTGSLDHLPEHPALDFHRGSVLDSAAVAAASRDIDLVLHLAGVVGVRLAASRPEVANEVSVRGTRNVLDAVRAPVVFFSSSAVYGVDSDASTDEDRPILYEDACAYDGGLTGYAAGKWSAEQLVLRAASEGRAAMIVRPFNVVGRGQTGTYGMVLPRFLACARAGRPLTIHGDGRQVRCFSDVGAFVNVLWKLMRNRAAWYPPTNVVNAGSPEPTSILDLAAFVLEATGARVPLRFVPYEQVFPGRCDVQRRIPDLRRLECLIGLTKWPDMRSIVRGLSSVSNRLPRRVMVSESSVPLQGGP
jgi:UDP-glucose 4-epimerase